MRQAVVCAGDSWSPDNDDYDRRRLQHLLDRSTLRILVKHSHRDRLRPMPCEQLQGCSSLQLPLILWRSARKHGPIQMTGMPNSKTAALGLLGTVMLVPAHVLGQVSAMA